jgi:hypothetical protein
MRHRIPGGISPFYGRFRARHASPPTARSLRLAFYRNNGQLFDGGHLFADINPTDRGPTRATPASDIRIALA